MLGSLGEETGMSGPPAFGLEHSELRGGDGVVGPARFERARPAQVSADSRGRSL
jgi:hypothetical protein